MERSLSMLSSKRTATFVGVATSNADFDLTSFPYAVTIEHGWEHQLRYT